MSDTSHRFLRLNAVLDKTGLSRSTLYRKVQEGTFPKQITIGARCVAWLESEIEEWMRNPMFYETSDRAG
ncbi:helix-turn-helix transcriptional regulator [Pelagerythrobacter aerophilus]|uniref:AlpA family phage regulatory protein n=1 Tax=Pelagerythrobacter aerophilus TaxID=2306995 RepID=A0A418NMR3_9SPHN|nr:AlpA family transcriptional regulator [Pelagerythrobacter aerophilus]RIV81564.1 AlpA family phage regulatory protein [Pelagerythrobacter aerophilus]